MSEQVWEMIIVGGNDNEADNLEIFMLKGFLKLST